MGGGRAQGVDCEAACHIGCLDTPLSEVPEGDWFCSDVCKTQAGEDAEENAWRKQRDARFRAFMRQRRAGTFVPPGAWEVKVSELNKLSGSKVGFQALAKDTKMPTSVRHEIETKDFDDWDGVCFQSCMASVLSCCSMEFSHLVPLPQLMCWRPPSVAQTSLSLSNKPCMQQALSEPPPQHQRRPRRRRSTSHTGLPMLACAHQPGT